MIISRHYGVRLSSRARLPNSCYVLAAMGLVWLAVSPTAPAADLSEGENLLNSGQYERCLELAAAAIEQTPWSESWRQMQIRCQLALGAYPAAMSALEDALPRHQTSLTLRLLGRDVYRMNDRPAMAEALLEQMEALLQRYASRHLDAAQRVLLARVLLLRGADARQVLELVYDRIKQERPDLVEAYMGSGDLALEKQDYGVAVDEFTRALRLRPDHADLHFRLAQAYAASDGERSAAALARCLELNPRHSDALLLEVDRCIDAEQYETATELLDRVDGINPAHPSAWAYRAVLAHLESDADGEACCRQTALCAWTTNPAVDHLIGSKLSQKYRFAEGAVYQRRALALDADCLPARLQLSQDLLRLGQDTEGWQLAEQVHQRDGYNVLAYNLVTLQDTMARFRTLQDEQFLVRMGADEAEIYGQEVLALLRRARDELCAKYDVDLTQQIVVDIFPEQKDFAVRTFGLPGGEGFLGVCFGSVVTANSPASQGASPANWQSVLWHEFCHVVTLHKTANKMPRWLSEGISVYEERQADPAWGESMTPQYREMILGGDLTPVSQLSGAFLNPPSPLHLQFAYYESSLVVEFLIDRFGLPVLQRILVDLGVGMPVNDSLQRYAGSLEWLDEEFAVYAQGLAERFGPEADWTRPEPHILRDAASLAAFGAQHPDNFWVLRAEAEQALQAQQWQRAAAPLQRLLQLCPQHSEPGSAYQQLAEVHRRLGAHDQERQVLEQWASRSPDCLPAYLRLMELAADADDWQAVLTNAQRLLAVNPLLRDPHRRRAEAAEKLGDAAMAIESYRRCLLSDPLDPAGTHYRLARLLYQTGEADAARHHVLRALEDAPRFREAHRLLLEIVREEDDG